MSAKPQGPRLMDRPAVRAAAGWLFAQYLRLVALTSRTVSQPPRARTYLSGLAPAIVVSWHGNNFLSFLAIAERSRFAFLISHHPDGQIVAATSRALGLKVISGSGMSFKQMHGTGGVSAFRAMLRALDEGLSVGLTGDVPPVPGRQVSPAIIALARRSGRPIVPMATASSRRTVFTRMWDRMQINHPFSRIGLVVGEPIHVRDDGRSDEAIATEVKVRLDVALDTAFALADGRLKP